MVIDALRKIYRLKELRECMKISKSSYFYAKAAWEKPDKDQSLRQEIRKAFASVNGSYGYRRLYAVLQGLGHRVSEKVVRRLMKEEHLVVRTVKRGGIIPILGRSARRRPNLSPGIFTQKKPTKSG